MLGSSKLLGAVGLHIRRAQSIKTLVKLCYEGSRNVNHDLCGYPPSVHIHTRIYKHIYIYIDTCIHIYIYAYMYGHIYIYMRTFIYLYACMYVCMYVCTYVCMYVCIYVYLTLRGAPCFALFGKLWKGSLASAGDDRASPNDCALK